MLGHAGLAINLMKDKEVRIMLDSETEYACLFKRFIITHIFPVLLNSPSIMFDLFDKSKTHQVRKLILQIFCLVPKSTLCIELYMCYFFKKSICIANKNELLTMLKNNDMNVFNAGLNCDSEITFNAAKDFINQNYNESKKSLLSILSNLKKLYNEDYHWCYLIAALVLCFSAQSFSNHSHNLFNNRKLMICNTNEIWGTNQSEFTFNLQKIEKQLSSTKVPSFINLVQIDMNKNPLNIYLNCFLPQRTLNSKYKKECIEIMANYNIFSHVYSAYNCFSCGYKTILNHTENERICNEAFYRKISSQNNSKVIYQRSLFCFIESQEKYHELLPSLLFAEFFFLRWKKIYNETQIEFPEANPVFKFMPRLKVHNDKMGLYHLHSLAFSNCGNCKFEENTKQVIIEVPDFIPPVMMEVSSKFLSFDYLYAGEKNNIEKRVYEHSIIYLSECSYATQSTLFHFHSRLLAFYMGMSILGARDCNAKNTIVQPYNESIENEYAVPFRLKVVPSTISNFELNAECIFDGLHKDIKKEILEDEEYVYKSLQLAGYILIDCLSRGDLTKFATFSPGIQANIKDLTVIIIERLGTLKKLIFEFAKLYKVSK